MHFTHIALGATGLVLVVASFMAGRASAPRTDPSAPGAAGDRSRAVTGSQPYVSTGRSGKADGPLARSGGGSAGGEWSPGGSAGSGGSGGGDDGGGLPKPPGELSLPEQLLEKKGIALFDENYEVNPELAEVLGLSEPERVRLNQTLKNTLDEIDKMREQSVELRSRSESQMFLKIRSFGEKGAEVRTALQEDLREQLGDERYAAFMIMTQDSLESEYFEFGRAYQTISYNFYNSQNTGTPRVRIIDEVHIPQGNGGWTVIRNKDNYDSLPEDYQRYFQVADDAGVTPTPTSVVSPAPTPVPTPPPSGQSP